MPDLKPPSEVLDDLLVGMVVIAVGLALVGSMLWVLSHVSTRTAILTVITIMVLSVATGGGGR